MVYRVPQDSNIGPRPSITTAIFQNLLMGSPLLCNTLTTRRWQECTIYLSITFRYGEGKGYNFAQMIW